MKKTGPAVALLTLVLCSGRATPSSGPLPPPVEVETSTTRLPDGWTEVSIVLTPREDVHLDVSCLLPMGVEVVAEKEAMLTFADRSFMEGPPDPDAEVYVNSLWMWAGEIKKGSRREFSFQAKVLDGKPHKLVARAMALAQWGAKDAVLEVAP